MLYGTLRAVGSLAVRWLYREVRVEGAGRVPAGVPLLLVANHPNQLLDALLVGLAMPREVTYTGKAVLLDHPATRLILSRLPFVPLRRAADERKRLQSAATQRAPVDPGRNAASFGAILDALAERRAVLIFPEGISHDRPELAPLKTGAARIALMARDERGLADLHLVPVGLTFEKKWAPRTRALVEVGEPLRVGDWAPPDGLAPADALTAELDRRLRAVTLNFPTPAARAEVLVATASLAAALDAVVGDVRPLGAADPPLATLAAVARRAERVRAALDDAPPALAERAARLRGRLDAFAREAAALGVPPNEVGLPLGVLPGARFVARELALLLVGGPLALWGRAHHWLPLRLARLAARRTSRTPEDPAMHVLVAGLVVVPVFYVAVGALAWRLAGPWWALAWVASLPAAGTWALRFAERLARARRRARAYLAFRRDPGRQHRLQADAAWLRDEALALEALAAARFEPRDARRETRDARRETRDARRETRDARR